MGRSELRALLAGLPAQKHPNLLVGFDTSDDAGVFQLNKKQAIIQTVDFFPPIVDDPFLFGKIAAANALSDVYAMGGTPLTVMNLVCYPSKVIPMSAVRSILRGSMRQVEEAGAVVVGGHTIEDSELKFGLSVTGLADPENLMTNSAVHDGDTLVLTKAIGTGIITTALKKQGTTLAWASDALDSMQLLNADAARILRTYGVKAATDVTGFGLIGHALEMALASRLTIRLEAVSVPLFRNVKKLAQNIDYLTRANHSNRVNTSKYVSFAKKIDEVSKRLLFDPQTSGGLLFSISNNRVAAVLKALRKTGLQQASVVGQAVHGKPSVEIY
ncbi:MAG: selenide, water dikinase SelD [Bacteroidetes bacterium]|nr:selenide, water dikinase SelD [Bacteroidota bacterium]